MARNQTCTVCHREAVALASYPNDAYPNLRRRAWFCQTHYTAICDDYGLTEVRLIKAVVEDRPFLADLFTVPYTRS